MPSNNVHKSSPGAILSAVVAEMAKPRMAESAKEVGDKLASEDERAGPLLANKRKCASAELKTRAVLKDPVEMQKQPDGSSIVKSKPPKR